MHKQIFEQKKCSVLIFSQAKGGGEVVYTSMFINNFHKYTNISARGLLPGDFF